MYKVIFRTPHKTPKGLGDNWAKQPVKVLVRWGAGGKVRNSNKPLRRPVEVNSLPAILTNADKIKMKETLRDKGISSPEFVENDDIGRKMFKDNGWNVVFKKRFHSGGKGMEFESVDNIDKFSAPQYAGGILERRINTKREFRIQIAVGTGKYFAIEKLRRKDKLNEKSRNLDNCVFKEDFVKPADWDKAVELAENATKAMNLDYSAVDIAWSGAKWYVIETNSAPGLGDKTKAFAAAAVEEIIKNKVKEYLDKR